MYWIYLLPHVSADVYGHQQVIVEILKKECIIFFVEAIPLCYGIEGQ